MQNRLKQGTKLCTSTGTVTVLASDLPDVLAVETSDTTVKVRGVEHNMPKI
ncbi:MAG: hypothetical protein ACI4LI_05520 [Candidatus Fimenecus sp.]